MISRLFQIVYKLMDCPQMTAKELAAEVGVSERTIYRDVEKLSLAGIPIYANQGKNGGIALLPNYVLDKTVLSDDEKKQKISNLLSVTLAARKKLIRNTGGKGKSCWVLTDAGASQCRLYNQSCRRTCKTL